MSLHLAIEAIGVRFGGGATVLWDLLDAARRDSRFDRITVFCSPKHQRRFHLPKSLQLREVEVEKLHASPARRLLWLYGQLPRQMERIGAHVLISMSGTGRAARGRPHLPLIQQSLPFSPEALDSLSFVARLRNHAIRQAMRFSCSRSTAVLVQTQTMKDAVCDAFRLEGERVRVVSYSVREPLEPGVPSILLDRMRRAPSGYRLLYVGNNSAYKNVEILLDALKHLSKRYPEMRLFMTCPADGPPWHENAFCTGYLDEAAVCEAYRLADLLIMPSFTESVGLPLLEAMSSGTPVLAADRPYAREVCEDAADYFDPRDFRSLAAAIERLTGDGDRRRELARRGLAIAARQRAIRPYQAMLDAAALAATQPAPG